MPCYTVRLISVEFKAQNENILQAAADLLDWRFIKYGNRITVGPVTVYLDKQKAEAKDQADINALKVAYSQAAVKVAARSKGWTLDQWKTTAGIKTTIATKY